MKKIFFVAICGSLLFLVHIFPVLAGGNLTTKISSDPSPPFNDAVALAVGDEIKFTREIPSAVNVTFAWDYDSSLMACSDPKNQSAATLKCKALKTGTTIVSIVYYSGEFKYPSANSIYVSVGTPEPKVYSEHGRQPIGTNEEITLKLGTRTSYKVQLPGQDYRAYWSFDPAILKCPLEGEGTSLYLECTAVKAGETKVTAKVQDRAMRTFQALNVLYIKVEGGSSGQIFQTPSSTAMPVPVIYPTPQRREEPPLRRFNPSIAIDEEYLEDDEEEEEVEPYFDLKELTLYSRLLRHKLDTTLKVLRFKAEFEYVGTGEYSFEDLEAPVVAELSCRFGSAANTAYEEDIEMNYDVRRGTLPLRKGHRVVVAGYIPMPAKFIDYLTGGLTWCELTYYSTSGFVTESYVVQKVGKQLRLTPLN